MSSIFRKDDNYVDKPKRNSFDMSHQNNLSLKFGELVPVLCQPVYPGDSVKIDPSFGLRYMPQVFPVQTRQRASIKYYYVRNRNLWKDWPDFIGKTKTGLVPPYVKFTNSNEHFYYLRPSSTADYLNWPIKIDVPSGSTKSFKLANPQVSQDTKWTYIPQGGVFSNKLVNQWQSINVRRNVDSIMYLPASGDNNNYNLQGIYGATSSSQFSEDSQAFEQPYILNGSLGTSRQITVINFAPLRKAWRPKFPLKVVAYQSAWTSKPAFLICRSTDGEDIALFIPAEGLEMLTNEVTINYIDSNGNKTNRTVKIESIIGVMQGNTSATAINFEIKITEWSVSVVANENDGLCWCDVDVSELPFASAVNPDGLRMSALPFRAVESIYNALVRNAENNPFYLNGVPEYNKFISSDEGGDTSAWPTMETYMCNWADDRFTTALPSPQQGNAPLVGLTGSQGATVVLGNSDGTQSTVHLKVNADTGNVEMVEGVSSDAPEYLNDAMMSAVEYGITINDLRNVNAFQRWLENNIRRGYKYKDQLMAHYGVNARYDVLDMPEFIGGVSRDVNVQQITATASTDDAMLGEYAGQSSVFGEGHSIEHYCDEHGFIIGLMCVYPMPIYQDTLPKYWTQQDPFDYYFPEFSKIGMQPILNREIAFSQSVVAGDMNGTFGYQRAWYDMLENLDTVHGDFRFDLRNFLMARDFKSMPKLNSDFLTVSSDDLNNTFYSHDNKDKILGQIYHHMSMKRPVPLVGIPSIE